MAGFESSLYRALALYLEFASKLDDQDRILAGESHQYNQANLHKDVVVAAREPYSKQSCADAHGNDEDDSEWQSPALVE